MDTETALQESLNQLGLRLTYSRGDDRPSDIGSVKSLAEALDQHQDEWEPGIGSAQIKADSDAQAARETLKPDHSAFDCQFGCAHHNAIGATDEQKPWLRNLSPQSRRQYTDEQLREAWEAQNRIERKPHGQKAED